MSAALQFPLPAAPPARSFVTSIHAAAPNAAAPTGEPRPHSQRQPQARPAEQESSQPLVTWAFYRKHTHSLLRRYLYASMQVGRAPNILGDSVGRGWVSSRPVRSFEDALIFVLDIERCLDRLSPLERQLISRILLQEYTHAEAASLVGMSVRSVCTKLPQAVDRLTELLVNADLLVIAG